MCCGWRWPVSSTRAGWETTACRRCSICASNAAPASRSVRSAWTWRGSRASSSPTTTIGMARRCRPRRSATCTCWRNGAPVRAGVECDCRERAGPLAQRAAAGTRSPPRAAGVDVETFAAQFRPAAPRSAAAWRSSTTRSPTTTIPRSAWPGRAVLRRLGFDVALAPNVCCGRPLISQGLLDGARNGRAQHRAAAPPRARRPAARLLRAELPLGDPRGRAGAAARRMTQRAQQLARQAMLFESVVEDACASAAAALSHARPSGSCCTATVIRSRWAWWRRPRRF